MKITNLKPRLPELRSSLPTHQPGSWRTGKTSGQMGYDYRWQMRRLAQLRAYPLCRYCERQGRVTAATVADHIIPHRGDPSLFAGPLQSLCATCHNTVKRAEERGEG